MEFPAFLGGERIVARYAYALLATVMALAVGGAMSPLVGTTNPYHPFWVAVVFAAWYCGAGPAFVTTITGLLAVWYWFLPQVHSFTLADPKPQIAGMAGFVLFSGAIIVLGEATRRAKEKSQREARERLRVEAELRQVQAELESRVAERTAALNLANDHLRHLSARLLQMQDQERRSLARNLHDSAGQLLTAIKMNIDAVQSTERNPISLKRLADSASLLDQLIGEIRTVAHLLHPPLLDEVGLPSAIRWYVDGFSQRSQIAVALDLADNLGRLGNETELAIFRVIQECLTNVHRHSGSRTASVRLVRDNGGIQVEVRDSGKGIPPEKRPVFGPSAQLGVGLGGMRERIAQLAGTFQVRSDESGTLVVATLPATPPQRNYEIPQGAA